MTQSIGGLAGPYYRHSNRITWPGVILGTAIGIGIACCASVAYAWCMFKSPSEKLCALIAVFYGFGLGWVTAKVMRTLKVRNLPITMLVTLIVTAVGYYLAWCVWLSIVFSQGKTTVSAMDLIRDPHRAYADAGHVYQVGTWGRQSSGSHKRVEAVHGTELGLLWIGEAIAIFGGGLVAAGAVMVDQPFCENCGQWCSKGLAFRTNVPSDNRQFVQSLEAHDLRAVEALGLAPPGAREFLQFTHQGCPQCQQLNTLSISRTKVKYNKKGQISGRTAHRIANKLLISPQELASLTQLARGTAAVK